MNRLLLCGICFKGDSCELLAVLANLGDVCDSWDCWQAVIIFTPEFEAQTGLSGCEPIYKTASRGLWNNLYL